jgi:type I restriction enzyme, S subunit
MIDGLKPYPFYKDSGTPWLGKVPEHWSVLPNRALFSEIKDREHPEEEMLSVTITRGVVRQSALLAESSKKDSSNLDRSAYKLVQPNDIPYNKMRAWQGAIGASSLKGIVSPAYVVMRPREVASAAYFHELFRTPMFAKEAERWSYGITSDMWSLRPEHFKMIYSVVPPLGEQAAIVGFLNHADRQIGRYIRAKQKLIKLLEEERQAIIHRAVTRGLDSNICFKPSGIEWLGDVPAHWDVESIKRLARTGGKTFTDGDWIELPYITDRGIRLIQTGNVGRGEYREKGFRYISEKTFLDLRCTEVHPKDVLICRLDGPVGRACLAPDLGGRAITSVDNTILKTRHDIDPRYVVYCLSSSVWLDFVQSLCRAGGGFRYRVSRSMLGNFRLPAPPLLEQRAIADHLDQTLASSSEAIRKERVAIDFLREFRTRLIADVVTGKLDVREVTARREKVSGAEPLDEIDDLSQDEEMAEPGELEADVTV